jgi:hypothetical protein
MHIRRKHNNFHSSTTYANDLSPPLRALTSFCWLCSFAESFCTIRSRVLSSWLNSIHPLDFFLLTIRRRNEHNRS